jgi:hypothetical protein
LIPIYCIELVELTGLRHPVVWSGFYSWFQILCIVCIPFSRGRMVCLFYFNGEFDPGSG